MRKLAKIGSNYKCEIRQILGQANCFSFQEKECLHMAPKWHRFLACFGNGSLGRLGTGPRLLSETFPRVLGTLVGYDMKHVSAGGSHTAALTGGLESQG